MTKPAIEFRALAELQPYPASARSNDHAVDRMVASIPEFGFRIPILAVRDGQIIDRHLRLKAARQMALGAVPQQPPSASLGLYERTVDCAAQAHPEGAKH